MTQNMKSMIAFKCYEWHKVMQFMMVDIKIIIALKVTRLWQLKKTIIICFI